MSFCIAGSMGESSDGKFSAMMRAFHEDAKMSDSKAMLISCPEMGSGQVRTKDAEEGELSDQGLRT